MKIGYIYARIVFGSNMLPVRSRVRVRDFHDFAIFNSAGCRPLGWL